MLSPLQLNEPVRFESVIVKPNSGFDSSNDLEEYSFAQRAGISVQHEESKIYGVKYRVYSREENNVPLIIDITMIGVFYFDETQLTPKKGGSEYSSEEVREIVLANGSNVIYGVIRQKLTEISIVAGDCTPIILPLVHPRFFVDPQRADESKAENT